MERNNMMDDNDFLDSVVNENNAEYTILYSLNTSCVDKSFLFQFQNIDIIKDILSKFVDFLNKIYKSYEIRLITIKEDAFESAEIQNPIGKIDSIEFLINEARKISEENNSYVFVKTNTNFLLVKKGEIDQSFDGIIQNKKSLIQRRNEKLDIDHIEEAFENYISHKKYNGCDYVKKVNGNYKVMDDVDEQVLRNDLFSFLRRRTKLHVHHELCTSLQNDEESVDIALINENNEAAIIEVKFFIQKGFFISELKNSVYSFNRFRDGYDQLNKYCMHLDVDNNFSLRYAYLYMFYAHSDSLETIEKKADEYRMEFLKSTDEKDTEKFRQHYKRTIYDNMVDISS